MKRLCLAVVGVLLCFVVSCGFAVSAGHRVREINAALTLCTEETENIYVAERLVSRVEQLWEKDRSFFYCLMQGEDIEPFEAALDDMRVIVTSGENDGIPAAAELCQKQLIKIVDTFGLSIEKIL